MSKAELVEVVKKYLGGKVSFVSHFIPARPSQAKDVRDRPYNSKKGMQ